MTLAEVYLPCEVGQVRVKLGFGDTLSPLEETALRVIAALEAQDASEHPATQIWQLTTLLGLGYRVVLDLVHDLWRAGHLVVDFASNSIGLSQDIRELLAAGRLAELAGVETEDRSVELMVERLTGYVMPVGGRRAPADPRLAVRFVDAELGLADAGQAEISQAIRSWLRHRHEPGRGNDADVEDAAPRARERRILSVRTAKQDREDGSGLRWYRLDVKAEISEASGRLVITVVDRSFPADRRELASERLTLLAEEFPREPFVVRLRAMAEERLVAPPPLVEIIDRLDALVAEGATVPAGKRRREHLDWIDEAKRITGMIDDRMAHEVDAEVVLAGEQHSKVVIQLINEAQTQLVIVCPWISYQALERLTPPLRAASDRGVQVIIIWGIGHDGALPDTVRNALDSLSRRARVAPMLRPLVSANTHAKLVISDDRAALITSRNVLSATGDRPEAGLLLRVPDGGDGAAIRDLLGWARINMPGADSRSVLHQANRFHHQATMARPAQTAPAEFPEEPTEDLDQPDAVRAWTLTWAEHVAALRQQLAARPRPAVRLVEDGAHRELLWIALVTARRRVVIASSQITDEVMSERMIAAIGDLLAGGVAVTIGYDGDGGIDRGQAAIEALGELSAAHPDLLTLNAANGHSKVLVWDDDVVVGSFNYLSYGGYGSSGGRHLVRSELSVRLAGAQIADSIAAACGEPPRITAQVTGSTVESTVVPPAFGLAATAARRIVRSVSDQRPGTVVRAELEQADDPWRVLDALDQLGNTAARRSAIAYCLAHHADRVSVEATCRWRRRLVDELRQVGDFTEALILLRQEKDEAASTHAFVLAALAGRGLPGSETALFDAVMQDELTADQRAALLAAAVGELLDTGQATTRDVVVELAGSASGSWAELAQLALNYHKQAAGARTAELMHSIAGQRQQAEGQEAAWIRLDLAVLQADAVPANLDGAKKTHAALFNDSGVFGRIRGMANRRDLDELRAVVKASFPAHDRADERAGEIIDAKWREVAPRNSLLIGKPRTKYVNRLAEVISAARELATPPKLLGEASEEPDHGESGVPHPDLLVAASELADGYRRLRPDLPAAGPLAAPATEAVLADLDQLVMGRLVSRHRGTDIDDSGTLGKWPSRWRYPELAVALASLAESDDRIPELLLRGLVDPMPPVQTARELIKAGEFRSVEALRDQVRLTAQEAAALLRELQEARSSAQARIRYEADALVRRGRRAEMTLTIDFEALDEQAERSLAEAQENLRGLLGIVKAAEQVLAEQFTAAVEDRLAEFPVTEEVAARWRDGVHACINAGEFAAARQLLAHDPREAPLQDPWTVPPPRPAWPFTEASSEATLSWYFDDGANGPVGFASWRPSPSDAPAWSLLKALRAHLGKRPSDLTATELCDALQQLVGGHYPAIRAVPVGAGWRGRVYLPDSLRLPPTAVLGREGIETWVAGPHHPPPDEGGNPVLWLVTGFDRPTSPRPGTMIVDLPFLLRLAAPLAAEGAAQEIRLVNLVRQLGKQLSAQTLLDEIGPRFGEPHLVWLLHLLGAACDGVVAEAIHHESGGRRELLVPLLAELLSAPVPDRGRHQLIDIPALNVVRQSGTWRAEALNRLLAPYWSDPAALMLLKVASAFEQGPFLLEDVQAGIRVIAPEEQAKTILALTDMQDGALRLRRSGLFEPALGGMWQLPDNGVRDLLATEWPGHDPLADAKTAVEAEFARHQEAAARIRAELSDDIVRVIGHSLANQQAAARSARARGELDLAWDILERVGSVHEMYTEAIGPVSVLRLDEVISDQLNATEYLNPAVKTSFQDDERLHVIANGWLLSQAFKNLFDNARQAIEDSHREFGDLRVTITTGPPRPGAERRCQVDIEDSGIGFKDWTLERFAAGEPFSGRGSRGTGLLTARLWFERYRGTLEIIDGSSSLGGGHVRVTLPVADRPGSA